MARQNLTLGAVVVDVLLVLVLADFIRTQLEIGWSGVAAVVCGCWYDAAEQAVEGLAEWWETGGEEAGVHFGGAPDG